MTPRRQPARTLTRRLLLAAAVGALGSVGAAQAADVAFPSRVVTMIVPYAPGGSTDTVARYIAERMSAKWGHQVIVENRAGAGGLIGAASVAGAAADGYTLLFCEGGFSTLAALRPTARGASLKEFAPVVTVGKWPYVVVVNSAVPANSLQEFIAHARSRPGALNYASGGNGNSTHLAGELFKKVTGTSMVHISYRGGAPAVMSVASGENQLAVMAVPSVVSFVKSGKMKALGVTSERRATALPDVPTTREAGLPAFNAQNWAGVFAPAGTPAELVKRINADIAAMLREPEVRTRLDTYSMEPSPASPERTEAFVREDIQRWSELIKSAKITID